MYISLYIYKGGRKKSPLREEIPHFQGQEWRLHFTGGQRNPNKTVGTGVAMRRYPIPKGKGEAPARW